MKLFAHTQAFPLFAHLFDDAALFPPGNAPMIEAVTAHGGHTRAWYADLLGWFVCPSTRLAELDSAAQHSRFRDVNVSMTLPGGLKDLDRGLAASAEYGWMHLKALEVPAASSSIGAAVTALGPVSDDGVRVFVEVPVLEVSAELASELKSAGLGLKLRTGGTTVEAFPTADALSAALNAACGSGVRFKCTAGLHHAIPFTQAGTGLRHHGFLNVLCAIAELQAGSPDVTETLANNDSATLSEQIRAMPSEQIRRVREQFCAIGTCSIDEPVRDLVTLGLVTVT